MMDRDGNREFELRMSERMRYKLALAAAHAGWWGAAVFTAIITQVPQEHYLRQYSIVIVVLIGLAIAAGLSLSRQRLQRVITNAFSTGMDTADKGVYDRQHEILENQKTMMGRLSDIEIGMEETAERYSGRVEEKLDLMKQDGEEHRYEGEGVHGTWTADPYKKKEEGNA